VVKPPGRVVNPWTSHGTRFKSGDCNSRSLVRVTGFTLDGLLKEALLKEALKEALLKIATHLF
jgi:hypothetical protein